MVVGLPTLGGHQDFYSSCIKGKQHWETYHRVRKVLELAHMDLCGPMQIVSLGGSLYFMLLVDDFSRLCWVFFLYQKREAFPRFSSWLVLTNKELG